MNRLLKKGLLVLIIVLFFLVLGRTIAFGIGYHTDEIGGIKVYYVEEKARMNFLCVDELLKDSTHLYTSPFKATIYIIIMATVFIILLIFIKAEKNNRRKMKNALEQNEKEKYDVYLKNKDDMIKKIIILNIILICYQIIVYLLSVNLVKKPLGVAMAYSSISIFDFLGDLIFLLIVIVIGIVGLSIFIKELKLYKKSGTVNNNVETEKRSFILSRLLFILSIIFVLEVFFGPIITVTKERYSAPKELSVINYVKIK